MNTFVLLKVKQAILDNPNIFDMVSWDCGTTGCIAGIAGRMIGEPLRCAFIPFERVGGQDNRKAYIDQKLYAVRRNLKLNIRQWERLVYLPEWPEILRNQYCESNTRSQLRAKIAAERIDLFIETEGMV